MTDPTVETPEQARKRRLQSWADGEVIEEHRAAIAEAKARIVLADAQVAEVQGRLLDTEKLQALKADLDAKEKELAEREAACVTGAANVEARAREQAAAHEAQGKKEIELRQKERSVKDREEAQTEWEKAEQLSQLVPSSRACYVAMCKNRISRGKQ